MSIHKTDHLYPKILTNKMASIIFGATGLCGLEILKHAEKLAKISEIVSVTRRAFPYESEKLTKRIETEPDNYAGIFKEVKPKICFSAFGTTKATAGSAKAFVDIDYGINYKIAKAAKESGVQTYVLISSLGASTSSPFFYLKTKGRLEEDVIALGFPRTIILRPGVLLGERDRPQRTFEKLGCFVSKYLHGSFLGNFTVAPIYGSEVGNAAVLLALESFNTSEGPVVDIYSGKEILDVIS